MRVLPKVAEAVKKQLTGLLEQARTAREVQSARDALTDFERCEAGWASRVEDALRRQLAPDAHRSHHEGAAGKLELLATEAVEDQLLASKLALSMVDQAHQEWADLKRRLTFIDNLEELPTHDAVRPDTVARILVDAWVNAGLSRDHWKTLTPLLHSQFAQELVPVYRDANQFLVTNGIMPKITLQHAVRKAAQGGSSGGPGHSGRTGTNTGGMSQGPQNDYTAHLGTPHLGSGYGGSGGPAGGPTGPGSGAEWWNRARQQTQDVVNRIRHLLNEPLFGGAVPGAPTYDLSEASQYAAGRSPEGTRTAGFPATVPASHGHPSPRLQALLSESRLMDFNAAPGAAGGWQRSQAPAQLGQVAQELRQQTTALKAAAELPNEKATIEVVALMFQSILSEDRIQPTLRVWFARLQIPVLRVALEEPDFFSSLQHPARRLIDRMGSCALGFDASLSESSAQALEAEIKRTVQVIEQYPETGRRVFQLALDEFLKFLATHLQSHGQTGRLVSVAQQVEQKETLAVQYTIELRKQLDDMPVHEDIRDFLFKVWAEVLAVGAVKLGPKHETMQSLKQTASDLLWAASAKPTRAERGQVIAQLPGLLVRLRKGMTLLGLEAAEQETTIKSLSHILAEAFMSRTETIPPEKLAAVTRNLSSLEDFLPQDGMDDLELDQESIELITGVDASSIEVLTQGGRPPSKAMRAWASELQLGTWLQLDHNNNPVQVQLAWRSDRGQLCLFTTAFQRFYLIQTARVASYLQAGLLVPVEGESLTVRATRAALEKLDANPERLLS